MSEANTSLLSTAEKKKTSKFVLASPENAITFSTSTLKSIDYNKDDIDTVRFNCIQSWFLAMAQNSKESFLCDLLNKINNKSLLIFLKALDCRKDKTNVYVTAYQTTNFVYDKNLHDHDRTLQKIYLEKTLKAELHWYETLEESNQLHIIFELLKLSGGALTRSIFYKALSIYQHRQDNASITETFPFMDINSGLFKTLIPPYDPEDPSSVEVEKATKKWNDAINKYRTQIEDKLKKQQEANEENSKNFKSAKTSKKKSKHMEQYLIDQVQLLPIWIVKRIFNFLDQKTLQTVKNVNTYWAYVVDDLMQERTTRNYINKTIKKIEATIDFAAIKVPPEKANSGRIPIVEKRMQKLSCRGSIHPKLRTADKKNTFQESLLLNATFKNKTRYVMPIENLQVFPRNEPIDCTLHKNTCDLKNTSSTSTSSTVTSAIEDLSNKSVGSKKSVNK